MPSTYTNNLGLEKPATGEQAGVWGTTVDRDFDCLDVGIDGNIQIQLSASTYTLSTTQDPLAQGRYKVIVWNGQLAAQATVTIAPPTAQKIYIMQNATTGGFPILFQQGQGGGFTLQPGHTAIIYADGGGSGAKVAGANYNPQVGALLVQGDLTVQGTVNFQQPAVYSQNATFQGTTTFSGPVVASGNVTLNLPGANAAGDLYYRGSTGTLVALPVGTPGQFLQAKAGATLGWTTVGIAVGMAIINATQYAVFAADATGNLTQDPYVRVNPTIGALGVGLTPTHSLHIGGVYQPDIWLDTSVVATSQREINFATQGLLRWQLYSPMAAETGNNAGSNLNLICYNDAASAWQQVMSWWRANGNVSIGIYGDVGAKLAVYGTAANQTPLLVQGTSNQAYLQIWRDSSGNPVATLDGTGSFWLKNASFLTTSGGGRLDLYGTVTGHPLGTIHIGQEPSTPTGIAGLRGSICMETASNQMDSIPVGAYRIFFRNRQMIVQYNNGNGQQLFAYMALPTSEGPLSWYATGNAGL